MRHRNHSGRLGINIGHRRSLLANLATALLTHGRIETTEAKARAVRPYVEKLITLGKRGDVHARRQALSSLRQRQIVDRLFSDVAPAFAGRPGGYTRMIKTGFRAGDAAPMALIELVEAGYEAKPVKAAKPAAKAKPAKAEPTVEAAAAETSPEAEVETTADDAAEESKGEDK